MRLGFKAVLLLLAGYAALMAAFAWAIDRWLHHFETALTHETVALLAREQGALISERMFEALLVDDATSRGRLRDRIEDVVSLSAVLSSLSVVDRQGRVVASDQLPVGEQLATPEQLFTDGPDIKAEARSRRAFFGSGDYVVYLPAIEGDRLLGYLRLAFHSDRVEALYQDARRHLMMAAVAGLAGVAVLGAALQVQLGRRAAALARVLDDGSAPGAAPPDGPPGDEFARAFAAATRMRRALTEARQESSRLHQGFDALAQVTKVGVVLVRADRQVDFANARALELLGAADLEGLKREWPELWAGLAPVLHSRTGEAGDGPAVVELPGPGGQGALRFEAYRLGGDDCDEFLVLVADPALLDTLETDVRLASQLEGLARVYRTAAHELRAPLSAMMVNLDLLQESLPGNGDTAPADTGRHEHYVGVLREELVRLNRSLAAMLNQSIPPSEARERFDLRRLLEELDTLLTPQARRQSVEMRLDLPGQEVPLVGSRDRLKQAFLNIAVNALEAMPGGGRLQLQMESEEGRARVSIADTGRGIPPELLDRIYDSDFTTKGGGSGIGLYVARTLVQFHGGTIMAHSEDGRGTRVEVVLPIVPRA